MAGTAFDFVERLCEAIEIVLGGLRFLICDLRFAGHSRLGSVNRFLPFELKAPKLELLLLEFGHALAHGSVAIAGEHDGDLVQGLQRELRN